MGDTAPEFGLRLGNIPRINLRNEFSAHIDLMRDESFRSSFRSGFRPSRPIQTPFFIWLGTPSEALTLMLQRAILGLEAWVSGAVWHELGFTNRLKGDAAKAVANPGSLSGKDMSRKLYRQLPALVREDAALDQANPKLWSRTVVFYRQVRNPLMHGKQVDQDSVESVLGCFEHIAPLHSWADSWHDYRRWLAPISRVRDRNDAAGTSAIPPERAARDNLSDDS
jgi:hypothetical protein